MNAPLSNEEQVEIVYSPGFEMLAKAGRNAVFPITSALTDGGTFSSHGISKRELFAAMAMQGYCTEGCGGIVERIASEAVKQADALITALEQVAK